MKWVVRGVIAVVVVAVLAVIGIFAVLATVDPNAYKERITAAVKESTGRDLVIAGKIETSLFPVLGFKVSGVELGNPPGFAEKDFLKVGTAQAGVKLLPLLHKHIELTKLVLTEPSIHIIKKAGGETNMSFGGNKAAAPNGAGSASGMDLQAGAIEIADAKIVYDDLETGKRTIIDPLSITLPGYTPGRETDISLHMVIKAADAAIRMDASAKAKVLPEEGKFDLTAVKVAMAVTSSALGDEMKINFDGAGKINTKTQDMDLNISALGLSWRGTDISGKAGIKGKFLNPAVSFSASSSAVNLDQLAGGAGEKKNASAEQPLLPVDLLRTLNLDGDIGIQKLVFNGLTLGNVTAKIVAKNGVLTIAPLKADFYQGKIDSHVSIDARSGTPVMAMKNIVSDIEVGDVLKVKMGNDYVTGKANGNCDLTATGNTVAALRNTAAGSVGFKFGEGYINKWQLSRLLNQAIAFFETGKISQDVSDKVYFTDLSATFNGQNGVFRNNDLVMKGPKVHALGDGVVNIAAQVVDYNVKVGLGTEPNASARHIPIRINGPLSSPGYSIDTQALIMDTAKDKLQEKLMNKLGGGKTTGTGGTEKTPEQMIKGIFGR